MFVINEIFIIFSPDETILIVLTKLDFYDDEISVFQFHYHQSLKFLYLSFIRDNKFYVL